MRAWKCCLAVGAKTRRRPRFLFRCIFSGLLHRLVPPLTSIPSLPPLLQSEVEMKFREEMRWLQKEIDHLKGELETSRRRRADTGGRGGGRG